MRRSAMRGGGAVGTAGQHGNAFNIHVYRCIFINIGMMIEVVCNPFLSEEKKKSMAHMHNQEGVFLGNDTKVRNEQAEDDCDWEKKHDEA